MSALVFKSLGEAMRVAGARILAARSRDHKAATSPPLQFARQQAVKPSDEVRHVRPAKPLQPVLPGIVVKKNLPAPKRREGALHKACVEWLELCARPEVPWCHPENEFIPVPGDLLDKSPRLRTWFFSVLNARKTKGIQKGAPDLIFCLPPNGQLAAVELKAPQGGTLSHEQIEWRSRIRAAGGLYETINDFDLFCELMRRWNVAREGR